MMMEKTINVAFQILPKSNEKDAYELVDSAIAVIENSGLKYRVCPFETVIEGKYDEVMHTIKLAQQACLDAGAKSFMTYIKIQADPLKDIRIEDKMDKYD
jgi:uncharacterized protein YqgV (UPF0045/DUF77 family)